MTDHTLHGNHEPCEACALRREVADTRPIFRPEIPCNVCGGVSWLPLSDAEIVRRTVDEARRIYWTGQADPGDYPTLRLHRQDLPAGPAPAEE